MNIERKGILIIDDSLDTINLITNILKKEGYIVRAINNGEQAVASIMEQPPELILLDIIMPGMNGFEVCKLIKNRPEFQNIPVLFLSASSNIEERIKGFKYGALDFIPKPFEFKELLARVRTHLELSRLQTQLKAIVETRTKELKLSNKKLEYELEKHKKTKKELENLLSEKEILIKELYHRTKNNMQVICSMLKLHSYFKNDDKNFSNFKEMENRIHTMALIHQKLFQSQNLSKIFFHDFIKQLCDFIVKSYNAEKNISFKLNISKILVLIDIAIPCGLILNELITNTIIHGHREHKKIKIGIDIYLTEKNIINIVYSDDGAGVPQGFDFNKSGKMGIRTIYYIGHHQLQGNVDFKSKNGIECKISFQDKNYISRL